MYERKTLDSIEFIHLLTAIWFRVPFSWGALLWFLDLWLFGDFNDQVISHDEAKFYMLQLKMVQCWLDRRKIQSNFVRIFNSYCKLLKCGGLFRFDYLFLSLITLISSGGSNCIQTDSQLEELGMKSSPIDSVLMKFFNQFLVSPDCC